MAGDFLDQLRAEMCRVLPTRSTREKEAFAALDVGEQAWRFLNWQSRRVHPHPRQVYEANGFESLPGVQKRRQEVDILLQSLMRGDDVNAYLSKDVEQGYCIHRGGKKDGLDFDLLLNEWGIHHLHIDSAPGRDGFKRRTDDVLYAMLGRGAAYVLAVAPHGAWTSRRLIAAAQCSWPQQGLFVALGVQPSQDCTEDEHKALRKAGLSTAAMYGDQLWVSGVTLGLTSALVSVRVSKESGKLLRCVHHVCEHPDQLLAHLKGDAAQNRLAWPSEPVVSLRWVSGPDRYCFAFVEEASGTCVFIGTS